jgi:hypothetical protein
MMMAMAFSWVLGPVVISTGTDNLDRSHCSVARLVPELVTADCVKVSVSVVVRQDVLGRVEILDESGDGLEDGFCGSDLGNFWLLVVGLIPYCNYTIAHSYYLAKHFLIFFRQ